MRGLLCLVVLMVAMPVAAAQPLVLGTEEVPELPDAAGDVATDPTYTGPTGVIDLTAAWFGHDNATGQVTATIAVADSTRLREAPAGQKLSCSFEGNVTGGAGEARHLSFRWLEGENHTEPLHSVVWNVQTTSGGTTGTSLQGLPHEFTYVLSAPGYFRFKVARSTLLGVGAQFEDPTGNCFAYAGTFGAPIVSGPFGPADAQDVAASKAIYSFADLRQSQRSDGERLDPVEAYERQNTTASPTESSTSASRPGTPALGPPAMFGVVVIGAALMRRGRGGG